MNCNEVATLIMKYMDGLLTDEERNKLDKHIKECDFCKEEFLTYQNIIKELQNFTRVEAPKGFEANIMNKIEDIEVEYSTKKAVSINNVVTPVLLGAFSLWFWIGIILVIYRQPILEYSIEQYNLNSLINTITPIINTASDYIGNLSKEIKNILSYEKEIINYFKIALSSILIALGSIKHHIYYNKKVKYD